MSISLQEVEARHLLFVGEKEGDVAAITGLDRRQIRKLWNSMQDYDEPYLAIEAGNILGVSNNTIYRSFDPKRASGAEDFTVTRKELLSVAEERLKANGESKARFMLFQGKPSRLAAIRARATIKQIEKWEKELQAAGIGPNDPGPFTVSQASLALGMHSGQLRGCCRQNRLGRKVGWWHLIERQELIDFGNLERKCGPPAAKSA